MVSRLLLSSSVVLVVACGELPPSDSLTDAGSNGNADAGLNGTGARVTFCEVQQLLQSKCWTCHGSNPVSGAPRLATKADLLASSTRGGTQLERSILRLQEQPVALAMPPNVGGTEADVNLLLDFRASNTPDCTSTIDAGVVTPVCTSGRFWTQGNNGDERMNPGEACISCHTGRRFTPIYPYMGTVYPTLHEQPLCNAASIPANTVVEILDTSNAVKVTIPVNPAYSGNFFGGPTSGAPSPYRARVKVNGQVRSEMLTFQTNGDCNSCHTTTGTNGAPGRITY